MEGESLPFEEAIKYFRQKVNLPTERWTDLWHGMHTRAFVVAGATKTELLSDLRGSIDKAISGGATLEDFRRDFDEIVARHGWSYNGGRNWRTNVMLERILYMDRQGDRAHRGGPRGYRPGLRIQRGRSRLGETDRPAGDGRGGAG